MGRRIAAHHEDDLLVADPIALDRVMAVRADPRVERGRIRLMLRHEDEGARWVADAEAQQGLHDAIGGRRSTTVTIRFRTEARACGRPFSVTTAPLPIGAVGASHSDER